MNRIVCGLLCAMVLIIWSGTATGDEELPPGTCTVTDTADTMDLYHLPSPLAGTMSLSAPGNEGPETKDHDLTYSGLAAITVKQPDADFTPTDDEVLQ